LGGSDNEYEYDESYSSSTYSLFAGGVIFDFALTRLFSLEAMLCVGGTQYGVLPVIPLLAKLGWRWSKIEFSAEAGYTIGAGFTTGGTFGFAAGTGSFFVKYMHIFYGNDSIDIGAVGYKFGLGNKQ
jgi:hypothetical protein